MTEAEHSEKNTVRNTARKTAKKQAEKPQAQADITAEKQDEKYTSDKSSGGKPENLHEGHRQKLRDRFINEGLSGFEQHNILELLLFYAIPRKDTNELAHRLINRFGSLSEVLNAPVERLQEAGISKNAAVLLSMMPGLFRAYTEDMIHREKVIGRNDIAELINNKLRGEMNEKVVLACLDNRGAVLKLETVGEGSVSFAAVDKRRIIELCLRHNATAAIIAHNHPRGFALPSREDILTTGDLKKALGVISVRLIDHIIVAADDYISLAQSDQFSDIFTF